MKAIGKMIDKKDLIQKFGLMDKNMKKIGKIKSTCIADIAYFNEQYNILQILEIDVNKKCQTEYLMKVINV